MLDQKSLELALANYTPPRLNGPLTLESVEAWVWLWEIIAYKERFLYVS